MNRKIGTFVKYGFLVFASILSVFPLVWMLIAATNKSVDGPSTNGVLRSRFPSVGQG